MPVKRRCPWCEFSELQIAYHDREWGVPVHDERRWFEFLILEGAQAFLAVQREFGSFDRYIRGFTGGKPLANRRRSMKDVPASSPESDAISKDLKKRGFRFVGTTICYAFMQATGLVNDHLVTCFRYRDLR